MSERIRESGHESWKKEVVLMKKKDLLILSLLRRNCRLSLTDISRATKVPVSTVYDKLKLFRGGIIRKHSAIIDFSKLGYIVKAHIILSVDRLQKDEFSSYMQNQASVNSFYRINNGYDFLAEVLCRDISEFEQFMDRLGGKFKIKDKKAFFIIDELKKEAFLADEGVLDV